MAKWIYDGDCMITSCCHTAYDINKFVIEGVKIYIPDKCPNCGAEMTDIEKEKTNEFTKTNT